MEVVGAGELWRVAAGPGAVAEATVAGELGRFWCCPPRGRWLPPAGESPVGLLQLSAQALLTMQELLASCR